MDSTPHKRRKPQDISAAQDDDALLNIATVCALTGLGASTIRKMVRAKRFPAPKVLGHNLRLWRAGDVRAWLKSKAAPEGAAAADVEPG